MDLLRHLRFFVTVAHERHFGRAAFSLGMTQPPLSQGILRLERRLGVRLFDRDAPGVRVTAIGSTLLPLAEELLRTADAFVEEAAAWSADPVVRLGIAGDMEDVAGDLVTAVAAVGAGGEVKPVVAGSVELVDRLKADELDAAVVRHPGVMDGLAAGPVHTLPRRVVSGGGPGRADAERHLGVEHGGQRLRETRLPFVVPPRRWQPAAHDQLVDALRRLGHSGSTTQEPDLVVRRALVAAGAGLGLAMDSDVCSMEPYGAGPDGLPSEPHLHGLSLRVRVVQPQAGERQADVDHALIAATLETALDALEPRSQSARADG